MHVSYLTFIFKKTEFILKKKIIKMISEKFSTNTESFNEFRHGRQIHLVTSDGMTLHRALFFIAQNLVCDVHIYIFFFCMIFEDASERSVNSQDYHNKQRKNYKEEKTNRTKIEIEAVMATKAWITVFLCLFFRYRMLSYIFDLDNTVPGGRNRTF